MTTQSDKHVNQEAMASTISKHTTTPTKQSFVAPKLTFVAPKLTKRGDFADRNVHQHTDAAVH